MANWSIYKAKDELTRVSREFGIIVVFFDGRNTIFENHEDIFTYLPQNEIRNVTAFFSDDDFVVEFNQELVANQQFRLVNPHARAMQNEVTCKAPNKLLVCTAVK